MPNQPYDFDYPFPLVKRYGGIVPEHSQIRSILDRNDANYAALYREFTKFSEELAEIQKSAGDPRIPHWDNGFFPPLDIVALFGIIGSTKPLRYVEIGSGNSTKVAHFAREKLGLEFSITSVDPQPRSEIDELCNQVIRAPLQECDLGIFSDLEKGDILFFDGSHRTLQNSDNQVLFFEIIPQLVPGVIIHIHDIFWPHDYPNEWGSRLYNEQYVLGAMILFAPSKFSVILPNAHVTMNTPHSRLLEKLWRDTSISGPERHGCSFWFTKN